MGGALVASFGDCAFAQLVPDTTLGSENSRVTPMTPTVEQIDGGATRGANLFHSFQEFNVGEGGSAYFTNPSGIENILTRITGANPSNILGTLGISGGNANLFLINPNGIIFGQNASLDVGGSFTATTANAIKLGDTGLFSASEPATSNLLTVRPSALFFNAVAPGAIVNQSLAQSLSGQTNSDVGPVGLQVPTGQTLALVGGNVAIEGGNLTAAGGRIELGSVAGVGEVSLSEIGNRWLYGYDNIDAFGNIRLEGGAFVDASGEGGGDVQLQGAQLEMTQGSAIYANTLGSGDGGEILVYTTETVALSDGSEIAAFVLGSGTGGDLTIATGRLLVRDGSQVSVGTFSTGKGGTLSVTASDMVEVIGTSADGRTLSGLFAQTSDEGDAGDLTIATRRLLVRDGAQVSASTFSTGEGGTLSVNASDAIEVIGRSANGRFGSALSAQTEGEGDAGDLTIATGRLLLRDGAQVSAGTFGTGEGGTLSVSASDTVEVIGTSADGQYPSALFADTEGEGNAGDLTIATRRLLLRDGAQVSAGTFGTGEGGTLSVTASDTVEMIGRSVDGRLGSGLYVQTEGEGDAGDLTIATRRLLLRDGAQVSATTFSTGEGGTLSVSASDTVEVIGTSADGQYPSALFADTEGEGNAGDLTIATRRLLLRDGAQVSAGTFGTGEGGTLSVTASDTVEVIGTSADGRSPSTLTTQTIGAGNARDLTIATEQLTIRDGAEVNVSSQGTGIAGSLRVDAKSIRLDKEGKISADTSGGGGNINLYTGNLILRRGSSISTNATGSNIPGGNITIDTDNLVAVPKEDSDITAKAQESFGGRVIINAQGIFGTQFRPQETPFSDITASSALGPQFNGVVQLNTPGIDPSRGLANLPTEVVDASNQIAQTCAAGGGEVGKNEFIITGRRGMPSNPYEMLSNEQALEDIRLPEGFSSRRNSNPDAAKAVTSQSVTTNPKPPIVEAQGWVMNDKGQVVLTATASTATPHNSLPPSATCPSI
jgi:filamentous hemagglutinin family protein